MSKLSQQDRKDLEKFTKFLIYKSLQIIVQSRLGEKIQAKSKPFSSGADWVNLYVNLLKFYVLHMLWVNYPLY